nr:RNA-directed DNA polymerase, eukaryota [Tanacetum cinerariifolium]
MRNVMIKLKFLNGKIREWLNDNRNKSKCVSDQFKEELQKLDADIDKGIGSDDIVNKRFEVLNSIQHLDKIKAMDVAQKAKIKWAIEGMRILDNRVHIDMNFPKSITIDQQLKRAVWKCGTDKSPGPDGFSFGFYRQFWSTIENDVFAEVLHFFTFGDIPNGCNSYFIALIPKVPDANLVKDFRPISLIGSMYKIIAKILANRLVGVLGDIVNEVQSAFITERQIFDGPFILNEVIQWCKLKKKQSLNFKSLHLSFRRVVDVGMFKGINLSLLVNLSHMFYADDAVFVGQWCEDNINTLVHVLECFFQASGLRINMCKSKITGVNVGDEKVNYAASKLECLILNTSFSYLGTKVGGNMSRVQAWTKVVDKSPLVVIFNGHELNSNKASWVKWKIMLASKEKGGLGVSSLYALNRALMMKWVWRFYSQKESLWTRVIKAIYGNDGHVGKVSKAGSRSCLRNIVNE